MADVNGFDPAAYSIDGARIASDLMRVQTYAGTSGAEGIVSPGDLKVHQLAQAGPQVAIDPGAGIVLGRSAGQRNQSYVVNGRLESRVDITPTGSAGGRSDLIIVRVEDPQFSPWDALPEADAPDHQYVNPIVIENVPSNTQSFAQLGEDYSALAVARLDIPANTAAITDDMIKPLRHLAQPRSLSRSYGGPPYNTMVLTPANSGGNFISLPQIPMVDIPEWATHWDIIGTANTQATDGSMGAARIAIGGGAQGSVLGQIINWQDEPFTLSAADLNREIPANMRGTGQEVALQVRVDVGQLAIIGWALVTFQIAFYERAI